MARKRYKPEEIVAKLRQVDVLVSQGQNMVDAIRQIGVSEEPLFWNYLFVDGHPDPNAWRAINSTRGIVRLLGSGPDGIPIEVPPRFW